jgi:translation initiation factor IF-1
VGFDQTVSREAEEVVPTVEAVVVEELPSLLYRLELSNKAKVLAYAAGAGQKNWVRLLPGDRVEVEFAEHDLSRGRILKKVN